MDGQVFDAVSKRWARSRTSRRRMLGTGGFGLATLAAAGLMPGRAAVSAAPVRQATPEATPAGAYPDAIAIDDTWFCNQTYALCNTAVCERAADNPSVEAMFRADAQRLRWRSRTCLGRAVVPDV